MAARKARRFISHGHLSPVTCIILSGLANGWGAGATLLRGLGLVVQEDAMPPKLISTILCGLLLASGMRLAGQQAPAPNAPPPNAPPPEQTLTPDQLDDLVAPIALYPDPLLSQVLVAATYPLELVEASQWLQKNPGVTGPALTEAAQQQNWEPSIQALVVFPEVIKLLTQDVTWTTNLGNAFLAQQADVMDAVQRMRQKAQQAGKLASTPQETVTTQNQGGQPEVVIEPANPDIMYVPAYDPAWIWGPALWYPYPLWIWPPRSMIIGGGFFGFWPGISMGFYFGGGWGGWGGWGWHPGWGNHAVIVNNTFIHRYNFNAAHITNLHGTTAWAHDPAHRVGVPYASAGVRQQYQGNVRQNLAPRSMPAAGRGSGGPATERMGNRTVPQNSTPARSGSAFGGYERGGMTQMHADHGYSSLGPSRSSPSGGARPSGGGGRPSGGGGGNRGGRR